ncbi:MAG: CDP-alcohol phosphatidyltransferase family protein [Kordiimonadaceae bacterium]|nr:CDP-alcohol phosphatidyltransferase family protein [Kordiimonadaceae bacterium]
MTETIAEAPAADCAKKAHEYGRPACIEDASNKYFIHPLSDVVVKFGLALKLTPNFVSLLGLASGILAGFLYYKMPEAGYIFGGFSAMIFWHILDGADGRLARLTGQTSAFGRVLDGICDHLVFAAVYIGVTLYLIDTGASNAIWWLVLTSGVAHGIQAAAYEERRQKYQRRVEGLGRDVQEGLLVIDGKRSAFASGYDKVQRFLSGGDYGLDAKLAELRAKPDAKACSDYFVNQTAPMVKAWGLLNANNRTFLIFLCALMGAPIWFFIIQLTVFNLLLVGLMIAERALEYKLIAEADGAGIL